jgi:hypothetical protein
VRADVYSGAIRSDGGAADHAGITRERLCGHGFIGWRHRPTYIGSPRR